MKVCEKCGKIFSHQSALYRHRKTTCLKEEIENSFVCHECNEKFVRKDGLVRHIKCRHSSVREFECLLCSRQFTLKSNLAKHVQTVHMTVKKKPSITDMECKLCCKKFSRIDNVKRHNRTVHGTRIVLEKKFLRVSAAFFECNECHAKYKRKDTLVQHMKCHMTGKRYFACTHCSRSYSQRSNLKRHLVSCKNLNSGTNCNKKTAVHSKRKEFKCLICGQTYDTARLINHHYEKGHLILYFYEYFEFASHKEFENWMSNERSMYIRCRMRNQWETDTNITKVYRCHRSGEKFQKAAPKRIRRTGSKKLNGFCPMFVTLKESKIDGTCFVKYQKTHVGHCCDENELAFMRLNENSKFDIPGKISLGVAKSSITENKLSDRQGSNSHLDELSYIDMTNVSLKFSLNKCSSVLNDDSLNVHNFVTKNKDFILFYKVQGEYDERFPTLAIDDFALGYMDNNQERALRRYGHKIVAFNGTYGTYPNDFILHAMSIQDVDFEGYPVAFLLSNRYDKDIIIILLQQIKQRVGIVKPKAIMSDMQHFYFNAWTEEMGPVLNKLYCIWHVHEALRRNYSKINNKELRQAVKKEVEHLSRELDKDLFEEKLNNLIRNYSSELLNFLKYFCSYVHTKEYWAYCYRKHVDCNTNMGFERFHKTFKEKTAGGLKIKSVHECLCLLQTYLKWKENENEKKSVKGKIFHETRANYTRHRTAEKLSTSKETYIKQLNGTSWQIQCFQDNEEDDVLVQKLEVKECTQYSDIVCSLPCYKCKICHHDFVCSCLDNAIRNCMCKHIHLLSLYLLEQKGEENKLAHEENSNQEEKAYKEDDFDREDALYIDEDFKQEQVLIIDEDFEQEQVILVDDDFEQEQVILVDENFEQQVVLVDEDFNQEQIVYVDEDSNKVNAADIGVKLENCKNEVEPKYQQDEKGATTLEVLQEIYQNFVVPTKPKLKSSP